MTYNLEQREYNIIIIATEVGVPKIPRLSPWSNDTFSRLARQRDVDGGQPV